MPLSPSVLAAAARPLLAAGALLALAACSSTPDAPPPSLPAARAAIGNVNVTDVSRYAATELQTARERLDAAEAAWRAENYVQSARLSEEALVTIRVAEAKTASARAEEARADVERTIRTLENEVGLGGSSLSGTTGGLGATGTATGTLGTATGTVGTTGTAGSALPPPVSAADPLPPPATPVVPPRP